MPGIEREAGFAQPEVVVSNYSKAEVNATASPTSLVTGSMRDKFQLNEIDPFDHSKQQPKHLDQVHKGLTYDAKPMVVKHTKSRKAGGKTIDNDFAHLVRSGYGSAQLPLCGCSPSEETRCLRQGDWFLCLGERGIASALDHSFNQTNHFT